MEESEEIKELITSGDAGSMEKRSSDLVDCVGKDLCRRVKREDCEASCASDIEGPRVASIATRLYVIDAEANQGCSNRLKKELHGSVLAEAASSFGERFYSVFRRAEVGDVA